MHADRYAGPMRLLAEEAGTPGLVGACFRMRASLFPSSARAVGFGWGRFGGGYEIWMTAT